MALTIYPDNLIDTTVTPARPQVFFLMLSRMVTAGWTCVRSGDAFSLFSATGSVFTSAESGAGGMNNNNAWFVMRMPGSSNRQFLFYLHQPNSPLWYKYSFSAGFTGGAFDTVPSATDEKAILGGAAFGGGLGVFTGGGSNIRVSMAFDNVAPYGWWMFAHRITRTLIETLLAFDPIANGTGPPGDLDPYVHLAAYKADAGTAHVFYNGSSVNPSESPACGTYKSLEGNYGSACWRNKGFAGENWATTAWHSPYGYPNLPALNRMGTNPSNGKDQLINVPYMIGAPPETSGGWKGVSSLFWFLSTDRGIGDAFTIASTRDYRSLAGMACKWDGSVPVIT